MSYTDSIGIQYKSAEGTITNTTESFTGDAHEGIDTTVPAATVDQVEGCSVDISKIKSCVLYAPLAVTVKTYLATVLKDTIPLVANKQLVWDINSTFALPFSSDFDTMKVSNADLTKSTAFKARFLLTD